MDRDKIIERFYALASRVGDIRYQERHAHDCFCEGRLEAYTPYYQFDEEILKFIEESVETALTKYLVDTNELGDQTFDEWG